MIFGFYFVLGVPGTFWILFVFFDFCVFVYHWIITSVSFLTFWAPSWLWLCLFFLLFLILALNLLAGCFLPLVIHFCLYFLRWRLFDTSWRLTLFSFGCFKRMFRPTPGLTYFSDRELPQLWETFCLQFWFSFIWKIFNLGSYTWDVLSARRSEHEYVLYLSEAWMCSEFGYQCPMSDKKGLNLYKDSFNPKISRRGTMAYGRNIALKFRIFSEIPNFWKLSSSTTFNGT